MLHAMRRGAKSWVAKGLIVLLIASFAVWGIGDAFSVRLDSAVAEVGDEVVTVDEYYNALQRQRNTLSQQAGQAISYEDMRRFGFDRRLLEGMIRDAAFRAELDRLAIKAPDTAVAEAIRDNPAFQATGGEFSEGSYVLSLGRLGMSPAEFEELTRTLLGQRILSEATEAEAEAVPGMAARIASFEAEQRNIAVVSLSLEATEDPGTPDGQTLLDYFSENRARYREPERRSGRYLHIDIAALAEANPPSEDEVRASYDETAERYAVPATRTIDQLPLNPDTAEADARSVIEGEQSFEDLATALGENPADLSLGRLERGDLPEAVAEAVFTTTEPGVIGPVQAPFGPVLIRITAAVVGGAPEFEELRPVLEQRLAREAALERAPQLATQIEDLRAEGADFATIATETGLTEQLFTGLARDATLPGGAFAEGFTATPALLEEVFTAFDLEEREILPTPGGGFFVVMVEEIEEAGTPGLEVVRERVVADWQRARRLSEVEAEAERLVRRLNGPETLAALAEERGLELRETGAFARAAAPADLPPELVVAVFAAEEGEAAATPAADGNSVLLAEVLNIEAPEPEILGVLSDQIDAELARLSAEDTRELFARAITQQFPVEIDEGTVDSVFGLLGSARANGG
ncbi:MAG: SurA N-terminal domain-containing protein [Pseudomonadota bacterium]